MAVINQLFRQSHFILYFLFILCLMPIQILVQSERVKVSSKSSYKRPKLRNKKVIRKKRNVPVGNVNFDKNSYYALLYVGGIVIVMICLMFFPNVYRKPIHYIKSLFKNSKIHSFGVGIKNIGDITFEYVKHYVEIGLNIINYKLIYKMIVHLIQYTKSLIIFYGDKNSIYNWLVNKKETLSEEEWGIEPNDSYGSSSPLLEYSRPRNVISKSNSFSKNKKGNNKKGNNKNQHGNRQKSEAILPMTNNQANIPYRIDTEHCSNSSHFASSVSPLSQISNNDQQNIIVNNMAVPSNSNQISNIIPIESEDTMVNITDKSIHNIELAPNDSVAISNNTYDAYSTELTSEIPREGNIEYSSVMNYDSYSTISNSLTDSTTINSKEGSLPLPSTNIVKMNKVSPSYENTTSNNRSNDQYFMAVPSSNHKNNIDHVDPSWTMETNSNRDGEKEQKIKGILVNKPTHLTEIKNDDAVFEIVNKKKGKRGHKHSLSFSVPLATTIESAGTKSNSHNRSSSSTTLSFEKEESVHPQTVLLNDPIPKDKNAYSNTVHSNRKQLRKRSISTPMPLDKGDLLEEKATVTINEKKRDQDKSNMNNNNVSHTRRYSTSIIDTTIRSYADVLNSNLDMNLNEEVIVIKNNNNNHSESNNKKNKKISKNTNSRSNSDQTNNSENTKSNQNNSEGGKGSNEMVNGNDQSNDRDENSNNNSSNGNNDNGNNGNNGGSNNNNTNNGNTGKAKNKKQKKATKNANANGNMEETEGEDNNPGASKKKAAKAKKETKGKNKVAADATDQGKVNGELKSPQTTQKKKAAKAAANAKKKEAKIVEESDLLVTCEITYGKAGLQDEPVPTDEEAYEALFSENATYWTPLERTDRIRNSPYYDHNHHIAKYGKIKYKPMIEYDTDMNEINSDLEGDEAAEKVKKEDKKEKKKKKKANANANVNGSANASVDDVEGKKDASEKKGKKKKATANKEDEDNSLVNEDQSPSEEKISKSKKKGKSTVMDSANDSSLESGNEKKSEEGKKAAKKKKLNAVKAKAETVESSSEVEIPLVPAKAKKVKKTKKTAKKAEISESEDEPEMFSSTLSSGTSLNNNINTTTNTTEMNSMIYSSSPPTNIGKGALPPLSQNSFKQHSNEDLLNSNNSSNSRSSLMFNKVSQPSPLSSVSYLNYYDDQSINNTDMNNTNMTTTTTTNNKPLGNSLNTSLAQSPILPVQTPTTPLFGPTTPKIDNSTIYSFTNGPSLTISTAPASNLNENNNPPPPEETIIDLFNRTNKSFRRPRSISLNSHFQPSNEFRSNLSPLLMSTLKNSTALKLDQSSLLPTEQYNNIKLSSGMSNNNNGSVNNSNNSNNNSLPFQNSLSDNDSNLFNSNNLSTNYIPTIPIHSMSMESNKETIPAQTPIKINGFNDFKMDNDSSLTSPIIKKPTENVIQRYRRARTLSSPAVPPSVDNKKSHFYSPFMTGLDIKYDFYIPKSNAVSPLSSSFTAGESRAFELNREEATRRRSRSINERNRPNINDF